MEIKNLKKIRKNFFKVECDYSNYLLALIINLVLWR